MFPKRCSHLTLFVVLLAPILIMTLCAADEHGTLLLCFLRLPMGEEIYDLKQDSSDSFVLSASFAYTERGSKVPLSATLRMKPDFTPFAFTSKGKSYRPFNVDSSVIANQDGKTASVREGDKTRQVILPDRYFTLSGYNLFPFR